MTKDEIMSDIQDLYEDFKQLTPENNPNDNGIEFHITEYIIDEFNAKNNGKINEKAIMEYLEYIIEDAFMEDYSEEETQEMISNYIHTNFQLKYSRENDLTGLIYND